MTAPSRFAAAVIAFAIALLGPSYAAAQDHGNWSRNTGIYEVNVRQYTPEGTFEAFSEHLDRLDSLGVGILWFMPIHPIGVQNRLGSLGSYYSVRDYLDVNPEFGTLEDFRALVDSVHARGMFVLVDWVANHTSWDNVLTTEHPEWYVTDASGRFIPPPGTNWSDVIELDYDEPGLRAWMIDALLFWLEDVGVDGFRFDAVDFVPEDFWTEVIEALTDARPDVLLLAEGDDPAYHDLGFHMTFGWQLYGFEGGVLKQIADGATVPAGRLWQFVIDERDMFGDAYRLYFTSNHDENSWSGTPDELFGEAAESFAVLTFILRGMPLIYSGQEAGLEKRLAFFDKDEIPWRDHPNRDLYAALLRLKRENRALWNGSHGGELTRVSNGSTADVFSFLREKEGHRVLGVFNLTPEARTVTLTGSDAAGRYHDVFSGAAVSLEAGESLDLDAWGYVVFAADGTETAEESDPVDIGFILEQNYPNPFRDETRFSYTLPDPSSVRFVVYDTTGREVRRQNEGTQTRGEHSLIFDRQGLASGVYHVRLIAGARSSDRLMVIAP